MDRSEDKPAQLDLLPGGGAMLEFEFTLRCELEDSDALLEVAMERLDATGSTGALLGASLTGILELQLVRHAATAEEAVNGAMSAVSRAFPGARLISLTAAPDTPLPT